MIYGGVEFATQTGSTTITSTRLREVIHIPYTNKSYTVEKGRKATIITTTITTFSETEKNSLLALLHTPGTSTLQVGAELYKQVESGESFTRQNRTKDFTDYWLIGATFTALDPIPYNAETGEAIYA